MNLDKYPIDASKDHTSYEFISEGPKGRIKKIVLYRKLIQWGENIFNLGFGDLNETEQNINDTITSNNNDRQKILTTIAATVLDFISHNPGAIIYAEGATPSRTRLYQMGISANWSEISELFEIYGFREQKWEPFQNGRNYESFIVIKKK